MKRVANRVLRSVAKKPSSSVCTLLRRPLMRKVVSCSRLSLRVRVKACGCVLQTAMARNAGDENQIRNSDKICSMAFFKTACSRRFYDRFKRHKIICNIMNNNTLYHIFWGLSWVDWG